MIDDITIARFVRGETTLKQAKNIRMRDVGTVEQKWIFALVWAWKEVGVRAPSDDQIVQRQCFDHLAPAEILEAREFLRETTEEAVMIELKRLRSIGGPP